MNGIFARCAALAALVLAGAASPGIATAAEDAAPATTRLSSVIVYSAKFERLADFYRAGLQLGEPATVLHNHVGFWLGPNYLGFEPLEEGGGPGNSVAAWFEVPDIEAAHARLLEAGATALMAPTRQEYGAIHATVRDPDGNLLGLIETR